MPKQINVKLGFEADTSQAKKQIQDLQNSLNNLLKTSSKDTSLGFSKEIAEAQQSIVKLQTALGNSLNVDSGRLDLSKLNNQLAQSGLSVETLGKQFQRLGPAGETAFLNLTQSIVTAQKPMLETNRLLDGMWTALKNTARWQLSSSILHGFMSSLSTAYGYAQDLNASLNSIRIVSGQSVEQMAKFADQANRSAQALSTSTLAYTDAALIFYQQGLTGDQVIERTDTVLKLSNVTGDSAEQVSSYMTAIWNNFYDGSQSLESFADKITALGAATASSSAEISAGLQQFAAIGNTVGLSYDYAATALATIVAQTRQSESTVGNGLRTIFARLSSLKQGGTDEDGTDLTKYTKALAEYGIQVKDENNNLKEMDQILEEIGAKWQALSDTQKVALAQTVGGVRQYATIMALFDNWDQFQKNLTVTQGAEGTLQEQAEIYEQSWEAARKRVQAAWQAIYQDLINDEFFINVLNTIEKVLSGVDHLIDSMGGLSGVLGAVGVAITVLFKDKIEGAFLSIGKTINVISGQAQKEANKLSQQFFTTAKNMFPSAAEFDFQSASADESRLKVQQLELSLVRDLKDAYASLPAISQENLNKHIQTVQELGEEVVLAKQLHEATLESAADAYVKLNALNPIKAKDLQGRDSDYEKLAGMRDYKSSDLYKEMTTPGKGAKGSEEAIKRYVDARIQAALNKNQVNQAVGALDEYKNATFKNAVSKEERYVDYLQKNKNGSRYGFEVEELDRLKNSTSKDVRQEFDDAYSNLLKTGPSEESLARWKQARNAMDDLNVSIEEQENLVKSLKAQQISKGLTEITQGVSMTVMGINSLKGAWEAIENPNLSGWEKLSSVLMSVSMGMPMLIDGLSKIYKNKDVLEEFFDSIKTKVGQLKTSIVDFVTEAGGIGPAISKILAGIGGPAGLLAYAAAAAALVLVIGAIRAEIQAIEDAKPENILKKANEALNESTQKAEEAKQAYEDLKSTLSEYSDLRENLNKLEGAEKTSAIAEENQKIIELLSHIDDWEHKIGEIHYDNNGLIILDETQQKILANEYAREASLERQKQLQDQLAVYNAQKGNVLGSDYEGPRATVYQEKYKDTGIYENKDVTGDLMEALASQGLNVHSNRETIIDAWEEILGNRDKASNFLDKVLEDEEAWNQAFAEYSGLLQTISASQDANARAMLSSGNNNNFNLLTDDSQNSVIETFNQLDVKQQETVEKALQNGANLKEAFASIGIELNNLVEDLEKVEAAAHDIKTEANVDDLTQYSGSTEDLIADIAELSKFLQDNADKYEELSHHLIECKEEADAVAYSMIRFDDAMQDVAENYEEWKEALNSKDIKAINDAVQDLKKTYGNLLDIDGSQLSDDFLKNAKNLEYLNQVLYGTEEEAVAAYNKLQDLANEEILIKFGVDPNFADDTVNYINQLKNDIGYEDIQIGASLDDTDLIAGLEAMINALASSEQEAERLMQGFGFDADVEEQEISEPEAREIIDLMPQVVPGAQHMEIPTIAQDGSMDYQGMDVPGLKYTGEKHSEGGESTKTFTALKIKSLHKSAGGNFKIHNSPARASARNNASKGSGGGGGGSSQPKKKTVKEHKKPEKKEDRYHDIKERIEDLNTELKRLEKTESRVYGKAKLKYMDQEIKKLEKQIELTDEYIAEIKKYGAIDQANLRGINMGATFDENGRLNNYEQVLANIVADYNKAIAAYNSEVDVFNASAQEDADNSRLEAADKAVNKAKEVYDERLKILDQYEDTFNLLQQKMDERIDQVWELFDQRLEKITWLVEFELDWNEKELTHFDWILKYIGKDADHAADAIANLSQQMGVYEDSLNWAKKGIEEIFDLHNISFDFDNADPQALYDQLADFMNQQNLESQLTEKEAEALLSYMDAMRDAYDGMYDAWMDAHDHMMKAWDEWQERLQNGLNDIAQYGKELEGIQKIVELTGRKMLKMTTQDINRMNQALVLNSQEYLRAATARRDALEPEVLAAEKHLQELIAGGASEEAINLAQEEYRTMMEDWQDATNEWYSAFADALQAGEDAFEAFIENTTKDYKEGFGKMDLDYMQEQFDRQKKVRDLYLDDYQKYHELNKTAQELNKSLADTNNDLIRGKMLDLQDEMNAAMQSGVQISAAQAEIYARRVALLQAEAELLDAQNAKSAVRMTRDNEGNFSYTYTADQEQVGEAQNNYGDKFYELLQYERDYADQIQEEMLQSFQDFIDRRNEIAELYKDDQDAYNQAMEDLQEEYLAYMDYYVGELDMDLYEMQRLRDDDWLDFENITGLKLAEHKDFITFFGDTITGELTGSYNTAGELAETWRGLMEESCKAATQAVSNYQTNTETTYNKAGENIETYGKKVNDKFDEMATKSTTTANTVVEMSGNMVTAMGDIQTAAYALDSVWVYVMDNMRTQIQTSLTALNTLMQSLDQVTGKAQATMAAVAAAAQAAASMGWNDLSGYGSAVGGVADAVSNLADRMKQAGKTTPPPVTQTAGTARGGGCFDAGTKIIMSDLSLKNIENIKVGDKVMAYNDETGLYEPRVVIKSYAHYNTPAMIQVILSNGVIMDMTPGHPLLSTNGWKSMDIENSLYEHGTIATLLKIGDELLGFNGNAFVINIIWRTIGDNYTTYNIEVDTCHTFIANGIVVHNAKVIIDALGVSGASGPAGAVGYASGGYTGSWGSEGKIAVLHEKELVLNETDTSNILSIVDMVRGLLSNIGSNGMLDSLSLAAGDATGLIGGFGKNLDQNVHIEANFPNVQSHTEIETALNNLINSASQYVNRKS